MQVKANSGKGFDGSYFKRPSQRGHKLLFGEHFEYCFCDNGSRALSTWEHRIIQGNWIAVNRDSEKYFKKNKANFKDNFDQILNF